MTQLLSYGGGRQTVALCLLIEQGIIPRPDRIVIADTGREKSSTWDYLATYMQPRMTAIGLPIEIAPRSLAYVDLYAHNGDLLIPVYTHTGKFSAFCSNEWKQRVIKRYLADVGITTYTAWIGFAWDERQRVKGEAGRAFPLIDRMLTKADCITIIERAGLPLPLPSACWMCPNMRDSEWRDVRDHYPDDWARAVALDDELRAEDRANGGSGVWLHHSRRPLIEADLDGQDDTRHARQCGLGLCFV